MVLSVLFQTISVTWQMAMICPIDVRDNNNEKLIWYLKSATQNYPKSIFRFNFYDKKFFSIVRGEYVNLAKKVKKFFFLKISKKIWFLSNLGSLSSNFRSVFHELFWQACWPMAWPKCHVTGQNFFSKLLCP